MSRKVISLLFVTLAVALSCSRYVDSKNPVRSLPESGPVPYDLMARISDRSVALSWDIADVSAVSKFRVYVADSTETEYVLRDSTAQLEATIGNLLVNQKYFFKIASVLKSGLEGPQSRAVSARVALMSLTIAGADKFTNARDVQVQFVAPVGTSHVMLSEDSAFGDASFETYAPTRDFRLSLGDGAKTVYGRLQFSDGSQSGALLRDDIILDTRAAIRSVRYFPSGRTFATADTIHFEVVAGETDGEASVSFTGVDRLALFDDGTHGDSTANNGTYSGYFVVPLNFNLVNGPVTGNFQDAAGNTAEAQIAPAALNIFTPPLPAKLTAVAVASYKVALTWAGSTSINFFVYRIFRSTTATVSNASELVTSLASRSVSSYTDTALNAGTKYFYRLYIYDNTGLFSASNIDSASTFANTAPAAVEFYVTNQTDSTATFAWTTSQEEDFQAYRVYRADSSNVTTSGELIQIVTDRFTDNFTYNPPAAGTFYFRIFVYDRHGAKTGSVASRMVVFTK